MVGMEFDNLLERIAVLDDEDAFRQVFGDFYAPLCIMAGRMVSPSVAQDVVQEVFVCLWESRHAIDIEVSLKGYLVASTRNGCLNYLKHRAVCDKYSDYMAAVSKDAAAMCADDLLSVRELESRLERTLALMPEEWRIAFVMSRMNGCKTADIARRLGVSERTVERFRKKAMLVVESEMKDYLPLVLIVLCRCH